jgi:hypothetical protein
MRPVRHTTIHTTQAPKPAQITLIVVGIAERNRMKTGSTEFLKPFTNRLLYQLSYVGFWALGYGLNRF